MSAFSLEASFRRAEARLGGARKPRADRGRFRVDEAAEAFLQERLSTQERPSLSALARELEAYCRAQGLPTPARTTLYNAIARAPVPPYRMDVLPEPVRAALYNLRSSDDDDAREVPGDQVVFYALNYGSPRAVSFAAGLPWLCLERALQRSGFRPKSRALLRAIMSYRGA